MKIKAFDVVAVVVIAVILGVVGVKLNAAWNGVNDAHKQTKSIQKGYDDKLKAMENGTYDAPVSNPPPVTPSVTTPTSTPAPTGWTLVATFRGGIDNFDTKTDTFTVGDRWKIEWKAKEGKYGNQGSTQAFVMTVPGAEYGDTKADGLAFAHNGAGYGTNLEYGGGQYYLHIIANQDYVLKVYTAR